MRITEIRVYRVELPLHEGAYRWSGGKSVAVFDSTIVAIATDDGLIGYGEVCPLGPAYLPAYAAGARTGIAEIGPILLGVDPTDVAVVEQRMDAALRGHPYVKSPLDMACWDLLGQVARQPLVKLWGGRFGDTFPLYRAISQDTPDAMGDRVAQYRADGYTKFQLKVGGDPGEDIARINAAARRLQPGDVLVADANTGWTQDRALRVADAVRHVDVYKVGGLSKACRIRDLCVGLGVGLTIEDTWGGDITTAAIAHLAHSTPPAHLFSSTDFNSYVTVSTAAGAPQRVSGRLSAPSSPGLGVQPRLDVLGDPVLVIR